MRETIGGGRPIEATVLGLEEAHEQLEQTHLHQCAYCGWLLTNKLFVKEHDELIRSHFAASQTQRIPQLGRTFPDTSKVRDQLERVGTNTQERAHELRAFLVKWRLSQLNAPGLPMPPAPNFPCGDTDMIPSQTKESVQIMAIPNVYPVDMEYIKTLISDTRDAALKHDHLAEWSKLVHRSNTARQSLSRLAKIFRVQHFWRQLNLRHARALEGNTERVEYAFADYFGCERCTIASYRDFIRNQHDKEDWLSKCTPIQPEVQ